MLKSASWLDLNIYRCQCRDRSIPRKIRSNKKEREKKNHIGLDSKRNRPPGDDGSSYIYLSVAVSPQPLENQRLIALLVGCISSDVVRDNDKGTVIGASVLVPEEICDIVTDLVIGEL